MKITFVQPDGTSQTVEAMPGTSVMEAAVFDMVDGIIGMCGGICSCATCHCYVDPDWVAKLPPPQAGEAGMIAELPDHRPESRLGCQIVLTEQLDGLRLTVPPSQAL